MTQNGRCYCGEVAYEATGEAQWCAQCHCRECQYISGGGPNYIMSYAADDFRYTEGAPKQFTRSDIPDPRTRDFCGNCGTHLITHLPARSAVVVKVGTLDNPTAFGTAKMAIFTCDKQPFHEIAEGVPVFDKRP